MSKFNTFALKSWNQLFEITGDLKSLGGYSPFWNFRGQSDKDWSLVPSLARILKSNEILHPSNATKIELSLMREFLTNYKHFEEFKNIEFGSNVNTTGGFILLWSLM